MRGKAKEKNNVKESENAKERRERICFTAKFLTRTPITVVYHRSIDGGWAHWALSKNSKLETN